MLAVVAMSYEEEAELTEEVCLYFFSFCLILNFEFANFLTEISDYNFRHKSDYVSYAELNLRIILN